MFIGNRTNMGVLLLGALCLHGQVAGTAAKRTFKHDRDIETSSVWTNFPQWGGEILAGYENNFSNGPIIYTIDRNGKRDETLFTFQDAGRINIYNIAVSLDGEIALVGSAFTNDSRGTTFLARIAPDRQRQTITRTWPYCPDVITFSPDGSIWTIGHMKDYQNTRDLEMYVLRRFDRAGKMLGSTTLQVKGDETAVASFLRASRDRIGWFTRGPQYIEFSLDGLEIGRYDRPAGAGEWDITGIAISDENEVVASWFGGGKAEFVILDREKRTWTAVALPKEHAPKWARVLGFDGSTLLTYSKNGRLTRFNTK